MEQQIKELRVKLDGLTQFVRTFEKSRELSLTVTSLELSKMWLGKVLKELGVANPYPESKNPANEKIEPTADVAKVDEREVLITKLRWNEFTYIQKVKWLRAEIEKVETDLTKISLRQFSRAEIALISSYESCIEAGMWLGMELGRIKENKESNKLTQGK